MARTSLNLLLMARGWLTQRQSIDAADQANGTGERLEDVLVRLGYVTEQQITLVRATQAGYPVYSLDKHRAKQTPGESYDRQRPGRLPTQDAVRQPLGITIPRTLVERYSMLPLHYSPEGRRLLLGFVYRVEPGLLYGIEQMTECRAEPCFITVSDFRAERTASEAILQSGARSPNDEIRFERPGRAFEMTKTVSTYAVEMQAEEARFGRTRDYLWARLKSATREVDLLFRQRGEKQSEHRPGRMAERQSA